MTNIWNLRGGWLLFIGLLTGLAFPLAPPVHAQASGFEASLRLGYGVALGEAQEGTDLNDGIAGQMPFWLDLGYRVTPELMLGLYGSYGIGFAGSNADEACDVADCSWQDIRLGIQAQFHLKPGESIDPWLGLGLGYEWMTMGMERSGVEISMTASGFEFVNLQGGVDFLIKPTFSIGPFIALSIAQYSDVSSDCEAPIANACPSFDDEIEDKAVHEWLFIGARGTFAP